MGGLPFLPSTESVTAVVPVSGVSNWSVDLIDNLNSTDLGEGETVCQSPEVPLTNGRPIMTRDDYDGTTLRVRLIYPDESLPYSGAFPLTIRVFATTDSDYWTVLRNLNGDASVPILTDPRYTDVHGFHPGTDTYATVPGGEPDGFFVTQPDNNAHSWDCDGYNKFLVAVEKPYSSGGTGDGNAYLQFRIV